MTAHLADEPFLIERWEYTVEDMESPDHDADWNKLGAEGWEVVGRYSDNSPSWIFKRRLPNQGHQTDDDV